MLSSVDPLPIPSTLPLLSWILEVLLLLLLDMVLCRGGSEESEEESESDFATAAAATAARSSIRRANESWRREAVRCLSAVLTNTSNRAEDARVGAGWMIFLAVGSREAYADRGGGEEGGGGGQSESESDPDEDEDEDEDANDLESSLIGWVGLFGWVGLVGLELLLLLLLFGLVGLELLLTLLVLTLLLSWLLLLDGSPEEERSKSTWCGDCGGWVLLSPLSSHSPLPL